MKVYEAIYKEGETEGIYALSVVENPAMQDLWITLSEHPKKIELAAVDEEKRLLLGAALIPNKRIYRNIDGNEFEMFFTEQTIEKLAHNFIKKGNQNNSSLEHEIKLEGMSVVEAWTVQDPEKDKSANYGKKFPKGTWVTMMKVDNDDVWAKAKNGEIKGFSIDALLGLQELKLKSNINMEKKDILDTLKEFFTGKEVVELKSEEPVTEEVKETFNVDAFKTVLAEQLAEMVKENDEKIEAFKAEFKSQLEAKDAEVEAKNAEIEALKVEMNKQPEVEAVKAKPAVERTAIAHNRPETMEDRVFNNLAKMVWNNG